MMYSLSMKRGKKAVFIGLFPSLYRLSVVECNLEWDPSWKPVIEEKEVPECQSRSSCRLPTKSPIGLTSR
jgi:hypothetical protein